MRRPPAKSLGRWSLGLDAAYCAVAGMLFVLLAPLVARSLALPAATILLVGVIVIVWAGLICGMLAMLPLRWSLRIEMWANVAAAIAITVLSATQLPVIPAVVGLAVALEERAGRKAVAELMAPPIDGSPVGEHQRLGDLLQRDPQVEHHQRCVTVVTVG